jgi:hypothetical protein
MKKVIPAVLAFAAVIVSAPARPVAAQDAAAPAAAGAQANDPEAQAAEAYKAWKAETDAAKKAESGAAIVTNYFGTKAAEAVAYDALFSKTATVEQKAAMARAYYDAATKAGKDGTYFEYALGTLVTSEKDPKRIIEYGTAYLQKFPTGKYVQPTDYVNPAISSGRATLFQEAVKAKNTQQAMQYANEALAKNENEFYYTYTLSTMALADMLTPDGAKIAYLNQVTPWTQRAIAFVEGGKVPATVTDKAAWEKGKPTVLANLYRTQALASMYETANAKPTSPDQYNATIDAFKKSLTHADHDAVTFYLMAQAYNAQYGILSQQYAALPDADKATDAGKAALAKVDAAADNVIDAYIKTMAYAGTNENLKKAVEPSLIQLYEYRHPDSKDAWKAEVQKLAATGGTAAAAAK